MLSFFKNRRRQQHRETPFPDDWESLLNESVRQWNWLSPEAKNRCRYLIQVYVSEKNWEGCNGLDLTTEMKVIIAAYMAYLVHGFAEEEYYDNVLSILVYPSTFYGKDVQSIGGGMVVEGQSARIGEAWYRGPVVLAWRDIERTISGVTFGRNVIAHEFAHQLDMLNGRIVDGTPPMPPEQTAEWQDALKHELFKLRELVRTRQPSLLDSYAATDESEFFAVATETFVENPRMFQKYLPDLYWFFSKYYQQDYCKIDDETDDDPDTE